MAYLRVRVTPGARDSSIGEWRDGALRVKVREAAERGKANEAVCALIAAALDVPARAVTVERGHTSRDKLLLADGVTDDEVKRRLGKPML